MNGEIFFRNYSEGRLRMAFNEVFFNELCLASGSIDYEKWIELVHVRNSLVEKGFRSCRISSKYRDLLKDLLEETKNQTIRNIFFQFFHVEFEPSTLEESEESLTNFLSHEILYKNMFAYGLALADFYDTLSLSFNVSEEWNKPSILVTKDGLPLEIHHVSERSHIFEHEQWLTSRDDVELVTTELRPEDKESHVRDDHGKDELEAFWKKLRKSKYVVACVNSLPWESYNKDFIRKKNNNMERGIINITLPWTDKGLGLAVKTTGRNKRETEKIARILEDEYSR